jgi:integrase/recombinase XerD
MAGKQAKTLTPAELDALLEHVRRRRDSLRCRVIILLSVRAGLRAAEIAKLEWQMIMDASGRIGQSIELEDRIAKKKHGRRIPIHPGLRGALAALLRRTPCPIGPVIRSRKGGHMRPNSLVCWFGALYRELGLAGCSSHSGRRSFITRAARKVHEAGGSLRDVQILAGHRSLVTTERYIDGDTSAQRRLVSLL